MALLNADGAPMEPPALTHDERIQRQNAAMLRDWADKVERGEVDSFALVALAKSGHPFEHLQIGRGAYTLLGQISQAHWRLLALINQPRGAQQ